MKFFATFALTWALSLLVIAQAESNPWVARYRLTLNQLQTTFDSLVKQGYRLNYISGYTIGDEPRYAGIWEKKPSPEWVARSNLTSFQFQTAFNVYVRAGYRLVLINGYPVKGQARYAAIWDKSPSGPWIARYGLTSTEFQLVFNRTVKQGYQLKQVSGYAIGNQARYAGIWEKTNGTTLWIARNGLSPTAFQKQFDILVDQGYRLTDINGYGVGNKDFYAGIWEKKGGPAWVARIGLTPEVFQSEFDKYVAQGYILKILSGYTVAGKDRYATLWEHV